MRPWPRIAGAAGLSIVLSGCLVTPQPLDQAELATRVTEELRSAYADQEPVRRPIDLGEAMARAVLYNLDHRVQRAEEVLKSRELTSANLAMLPSLAAEAGYTGRNNVDASSSQNVFTGQQSLATSTSQDRDLLTSSATLSWNILDLGLSYVSAQQAADKALASREVRRRVMAKVVEDVRSAYWRALAADYLATELTQLEKRARASLAQSRELVKNANVSPMTALAYQKEILEIQDRIQTVQAEVISARSELAALMNLPPGTRFSLVRPKSGQPPAALPSEESMLSAALENRSEMREAIYKERIADLDVRKAMIETLPGVNVLLSPNTTSNSFTLHETWWKLGAQASWNLMKVFTLPARKAQAEANLELEQLRTRALTSSIALQVMASRQRYDHARRRLQTAADFRSVQHEILEQIATSATLARTGDQELVREEMSALLARARYDVALAEVQSSYAVIQTTIGRDPYPELDRGDLAGVADAFRKKLASPVAAAPRS